MRVLWCVLAALAVSSCAPIKETSRFVPTESPAEVIRLVNLRKDSVQTFQGSGSISLESPSFANSVSFDVSVRKPDSVKIVFEGPFGIRLASALFTQQHFIFYNSLKNEVTEGNGSLTTMPMMLNFGVNAAEMLEILTGEQRIPSNYSPSDSFRVDDGSYILQFTRNGRTTRYNVDGRSLAIQSVDVSDSSGNAIISERYQYDHNDDGAIVPKLIQIILPASESSLSLSYDSVVLNHELQSLMLSIPTDAKRRTLDRGNNVR